MLWYKNNGSNVQDSVLLQWSCECVASSGDNVEAVDGVCHEDTQRIMMARFSASVWDCALGLPTWAEMILCPWGMEWDGFSLGCQIR